MTALVPAQSCGYQVFLSDLGIFSFLVGVIAELLGFVSIFVSFWTQLQTNLSVQFVGVPNAIVFLLTNFFNFVAPASVVNYINITALLDPLVGLLFAIPVGELNNLFGYFVSGIGLIGILLALLPTFPMEFNEIITALGFDLEEYFRSYGCHYNVLQNHYATHVFRL